MACIEGERRSTRSRRFYLPLFIVVLLMASPREGSAQFAFDWGGSASLEAGYEDDGSDGEAILEQIDSLWTSVSIARAASLFVQGSFVTNLDRPYLLDLDIARLSLKIPGVPYVDTEINIDLGRFVFADFSGFIINHKADGARLSFDFAYSSLSFTAGYTGYVLNPNSTIILSLSDAADSRDDDLTYGPARGIGMFLARFPDAFWGQDIVLSVIAQQDLRDKLVSGGERVNTQYLGLGSEGPLTPSLFIHVFGYLGFGTIGEETHIFSQFVGLGIKWYQETFYQSRLQARVLCASGERDTTSFYEGSVEHSRTFLPISERDTGIVFSPRMGNITLWELGYSLKPIDRLQTELKGLLFLRTAPGAISEGGIDTGDMHDRLLGPEVDLTANFRLYSDAGLTFGFGVFFPASGENGAFVDGSPRFKATVGAHVTF